MNHAETTPQAFQGTTDWPREGFGHVQFGDKRLKMRLFRMVERAAAEPSGRIIDVFKEPAERQAAYDFVSNPRVDVAEMLSSMASAPVKRAQEEPFIFVPVDGTSLTLTDNAMSKSFGPIGGRNEKVRGIKVVSAIGVNPTGIPLGMMAMTYWVRNDTSSSRTNRELCEAQDGWPTRSSACTSNTTLLSSIFQAQDSLAQAATGAFLVNLVDQLIDMK